jgi:hypothetical protein
MIRKRASLVIVSTVAVLCVAIYLWSPIQITTYKLPANARTGWYVIEYDNPQCQSLRHIGMWRTFEYPASGYLCTSSKPAMKWEYQRFYLDNDSTHDLKKEDKILKESGLIEGWYRCKIQLHVFWYGPREYLSSHPREGDRLHEMILQHHPEC